MAKADIGLIGLAVMGQNLAMNMNDHGFVVSVYNRTVSKVEEFMEGAAKGSQIIPSHSIEEFVGTLKAPRKIILMVKAGKPVDEFIAQLVPHLSKGDIIIDGGNSLFTDTNRRCAELAEKGILFVGAGISGGEEGARHGPSIMPGGNPAAWPHVKEIFQSISAKVDGGEPCCDWVGEGGAGHYVKMVHNGIEYGDMQLICESYQLLHKGLKLSTDELKTVYQNWNERELNSYLIEITSHIFGTKDQDGSPLVDKILDVAGQKGTGKWTVENALEMGMPLTLISEAVFARCLSAIKEERVSASRLLKGADDAIQIPKEKFIHHVENALYASKVISYAQGFMLMRQAASDYSWNLNYGAIALMWRGGCIIRSSFLGKIKEAYVKNPQLQNLILDPYFTKQIGDAQEGWRQTVAAASLAGIPVPCMGTALSFYDGYRSERLPANLLQAQRDYFGAHTYERTDKPRGQFFHTNWTGTGGSVSSTTYNV